MTADAGSGRPGVDAGHASAAIGSGRVLDDHGLSRTIAIAEAAERYAGLNLHEDPVYATAGELAGATIDLRRLPRCSKAEYARAGCPLVPFDESARIRWVKGTDMISGSEVWIPAVMTCYGIADVLPSERFWYLISTGHAIHPDPSTALFNAICEVAERDIIAVSWLQRLPMPLVSPRLLTERSNYITRWFRQHFVETYLFDATTDLGIPTAYCLQVAEHDPRGRHIVGCGTGNDMRAATEKALLEASMLRWVFHSEWRMPADFKDFLLITDGARYMGLPEHSPAFGFLLDGVHDRQLSEGGHELPRVPADALRQVLKNLAAAGMQIIAVDRTPRDLADAGLHSIVAVIPDLQPMSLHPLAQFRAHPRLYELPARMGYRCLSEDDLNPWPQPFA